MAIKKMLLDLNLYSYISLVDLMLDKMFIMTKTKSLPISKYF
jgi:hypothetical protein